MNYIPELNTLMPSLERRALIKTAISLWSPDDIHLRNPHDPRLPDIAWKDEKWIAEDHVIGKVKELPLPESLKKKISGFIKPIGFEILKWIMHYQNILSNGKIEVWLRSVVDVNKVGKSLCKLCWTPQGTVDIKKTAEELIRDENLDITECYRLSCVFCLENDILKLWNKMPDYCKRYFYFEENPLLYDFEPNELVVFWTHEIRRKRHRRTPYEYAFLSAEEYNNQLAIEYFWQHLTSVEREDFLVRTAELVFDQIDYQSSEEINGLPHYNVDILFFLLSQMNEEQQTLKKASWYVLARLLDWPYQDFFMETANRVWAFICVDTYLAFLEKIVDKVKDGFKDYDYKKLFREFWQQSSITYKEYATDDYLLLKLLQIEDKEYFEIIFESIPDREKFLFSEYGKNLCKSLIFNNEMDLLEVFVRECISSKDIIIKFREEIESYIIDSRSNETQEENVMWRTFFQLLNGIIQKYDKWKCVKEGNSGLAKRFCNSSNEEPSTSKE